MKTSLLFSLIWQKTVENAVQLEAMQFEGWVWTFLHLCIFLAIATFMANTLPADAYREDIKKRNRIYLGLGAAGFSSLFSYFFFVAKPHITSLGLQSAFLYGSLIYYVITWLAIYGLMVWVIYPLVFSNHNFAQVRELKK